MEITVRAFRFVLLPGFQFKVQTNKDGNRFIKALSTSLWYVCCCCYFFQNLHWGITHHETPLHLFATVRTCCRTTLAKLQIKPYMRKGSLILFQFKMNLSLWFFTKYTNLVTCKISINNVFLTSLQTAVSTGRSDGIEHNLVGKKKLK